MIEIWKDIKDFEGKFQVSNLGRVKRLAFTTFTDKNFRGKYENKEKILTQFTWQSRYLRVDFGYSENKIRHRRATYVHNLVAEAFLGPRPEGCVIDHIDGNYLNNQATNLRYVTQVENMNNPNNKPGMKGYHYSEEKRDYISQRTKEAMAKPEVIEKLKQRDLNRWGHSKHDN